MGDGLLIDEEDLIGSSIHAGACNREDRPCDLWVKADIHSIMLHGRQRHGDARTGGDRAITCTWSGCNRQMRASAMPWHTLSAHFGVRWMCSDTGCSKVFQGSGSFVAHANNHTCLAAYLGATVVYGPNIRIVRLTTTAI